MSEQTDRILDKLLRAAYRVLRDEYRGPEPDAWECRIGDTTGGKSPDEFIGKYDSEIEATVAMTRELDKRWPGMWEINAGRQFVAKKHGRDGNYVLASIHSRHSASQESQS